MGRCTHGLTATYHRSTRRPIMVGGAVAHPAADLAQLPCCWAARRLDSSSLHGAEESGLGKAAIYPFRDVRRKIPYNPELGGQNHTWQARFHLKKRHFARSIEWHFLQT